MKTKVNITICDIAEHNNSVANAIVAVCKENDTYTSGIIGPSFGTSGPIGEWRVNYGADDYARRAAKEEYGCAQYIDASDGRLANVSASGEVTWSENSVVELEAPNAKEIALYYPSKTVKAIYDALQNEQVLFKGGDGDEWIRAIWDTADSSIPDEYFAKLARMLDEAVGGHSWEIVTKEEWGTDKNGDDMCNTACTLSIIYQGETVHTGEETGYFCFCRRGREEFTEWQDADGYEHDSLWSGAVAAAVALGADEDDLTTEAPAEPAEPAKVSDGAYYLMYHGWQTPWGERSRYATEKDAVTAMRRADRATKDANSDGAYGWGYGVAVVADADEKADVEASDGTPLKFIQKGEEE